MSRLKTIPFLLLLATIIISGCASSDVKEKGGMSTYNTVKIKPSGFFEECVEVLPNQVMDFSFDASDSLNFNVHYHTKTEVQYPVNKKGISSWKGSLSPDELEFYTKDQENFCLMWDNPNSEAVKISFSCRVKSK
jgi:hypothetical protein